MKNLSSLIGFGSEYNNKYLVVVSGVKVVYSSAHFKVCKSRFLSLSEDICDYIEFIYQFYDGSLYVFDYRN